MIEVKELVKKYGNRVAVDHLSFTINDGQIYGFLGPNGAGKSTTMNMLTGFLAPTEGTVMINGYDMMEEPEKAKKSIGYLPEIPPLYQDMTVKEFLMFVAELKMVPGKERKEQVTQVMEQTDIMDISERLIKNLSKGYKQRVGLAQAMVGNPDVIILDEPMVGLDPKQIIEVRDLIKSLGQKHTIILSSHILSEVSAICDHVMIISHGRLVASDSPEGLQKMMKTAVLLELTVKASFSQLKTILESITEIERYEEKESTMDDCVTVLITSKEQEDIRETLSMKLYENHMPIMGMNQRENSLEDIFLELTQDEEANSEEAETEKAEIEKAETEEAEDLIEENEDAKMESEDEE